MSQDDILVWPDGTHCFRHELQEMTHMSDDYRVVAEGSPEHFMFLSTETVPVEVDGVPTMRPVSSYENGVAVPQTLENERVVHTLSGKSYIVTDTPAAQPEDDPLISKATEIRIDREPARPIIPYIDGITIQTSLISSDTTPTSVRGIVDLSFAALLERHRHWSLKTFGPGEQVERLLDHLRKELQEIEADPKDLGEWIDVVLIALDGARRSGATSEDIILALEVKQDRNERRKWPDWRTADPNKALEHDRTGEKPKQGPAYRFMRANVQGQWVVETCWTPGAPPPALAEACQEYPDLFKLEVLDTPLENKFDLWWENNKSNAALKGFKEMLRRAWAEGFEEGASKSLDIAADVVSLCDDATMKNHDHMLDAEECSSLVRSLKNFVIKFPNFEVESRPVADKPVNPTKRPLEGTRLKPCPLCGGAAKEHDRFNSNTVTCRSCGLKIKQSGMGEGDAAERWNRRPIFDAYGRER